MKVKPIKVDNNYVKNIVGKYVNEKYGMCVVDTSSQGIIIQDSVLEYKIPESFITECLQNIKSYGISGLKDNIDKCLYTNLITLILQLTYEKDIVS